jgi:hypothetical protein
MQFEAFETFPYLPKSDAKTSCWKSQSKTTGKLTASQICKDVPEPFWQIWRLNLLSTIN